MATTNNFDKMSYTELVKFHERIQGAIAEKRVSEAGAAKDHLRAAAEKAGFTLDELVGKRGARKAGVVKYRNPKDASQTWTGRGRKPNWLVDAVKKGAKIDAFKA